MTGEFLTTFWVVGGMTFVILLVMFVWENWLDASWRGLKMPVTFKQVLIDWAIYMNIFVLVSLLVRGLLSIACSVC